MKSLLRARIAGWYLFREMLPGLILGVVVFIFILLMFQALRLAEFFIVHGVALNIIGKIAIYLSVSFLPAILPMSLLFAVLLTFGRLSQDSEVVALKSTGLSMAHITFPALVLSTFVSYLCAETFFEIAPWGNRQFELLISELGNTQVAETIRSGTFSEGFFDLVVYANEVDAKSGDLQKVFIFDGRNDQMPLTIIAQKGKILARNKEKGQAATLRLLQGNIHRTTGASYTKINFERHDINLALPGNKSIADKSPPSLTLAELDDFLSKPDSSKNNQLHRTLLTEYHKRFAISFACIIFGILGVGLGTVTNRRAAKSSGLVISLGLIVGYWTLYVSGESLARNGTLLPWVGVWTPNFLFILLAVHFLRKSWV